MAENEDSKVDPTPVVQETVYELDDLKRGAMGAFGVMPEVVVGAMRRAGLTKATRDQAKEAVSAYIKGE